MISKCNYDKDANLNLTNDKKVNSTLPKLTTNNQFYITLIGNSTNKNYSVLDQRDFPTECLIKVIPNINQPTSKYKLVLKVGQ